MLDMQIYFERGMFIMFTRKIVIDNVEKVQALVKAATEAPFEVNIVDRSFTVNAKSIMGLFSIDRSYPLIMSVNADEVSDDAKVFLCKISDFIV